MLPLRVVLAVNGKPMVDSFVIVDDSVKLCELLGTALTQLGFGRLVDSAQGFIQVGNWKPLALEQISDDLAQPAAKLLKPVVYNVVLKIVVRQDQLQPRSPTMPATTPSMPSEADKCSNMSDPRLSDLETVDDDSEVGGTTSAKSDGFDETLEVEPSPQRASELPVTPEQMLLQFLQQQGPLFDAPAPSLCSVGRYEPKMTRSPSPDVRRYSPMTGPVKPCFDTLYEVPMLQDWYAQLKFPGKAQCQQYADELNSLSHRRTSPPLSLQTVNNWFKNRRRQDRKKGVMAAVKVEILGQRH